MGHRGRLQVKPEKKQRDSGPVPVAISDEWTDNGKVRVFTFSDGTKTRVPWKETKQAGDFEGFHRYEAPSFEEALERRSFPSEAVARENERCSPMWVNGARAVANGAVLFGIGVGALGVGVLFKGVSLAVDAAELALDVGGFVASLLGRS